MAELAPRELLRTLNRGGLCTDGARLRWERQVVMDMYDGNRIDYCPGPDWRGALPLSFFSSMAALAMAWRGALPFHACAVAIDGRAILIAGESGAGKSTLAAGLVVQGARFLADDLTVVAQAGEHFIVEYGRPALRLHQETAHWVRHERLEPAPDDPRGKYLATIATPDSCTAVPLGSIIVLSHRERSSDFAARWADLAAMQFRPAWMRALPHRAARERCLIALAQAVPVAHFAPITSYDADSFAARARAVGDLIRKLVA